MSTVCRSYCKNVSVWMSLYQGSYRVHFRDCMEECTKPYNHLFITAEKLHKLSRACRELESKEIRNETCPHSLVERATESVLVDASEDGAYVCEVGPDPGDQKAYLFGSRHVDFKKFYKQVKIVDLHRFIECLEVMMNCFEEIQEEASGVDEKAIAHLGRLTMDEKTTSEFPSTLKHAGAALTVPATPKSTAFGAGPMFTKARL